MGFPRATTMRSQPAIVGSTLFYPVADAATVYAIDVAGEPCVQWTYTSPAPLRTSAAFGTLPDGRAVVVTSGFDTVVHAIDALTGAPVWRTKIGTNPYSLTTGTPVIHGDMVLAPISAFEITVGAMDTHECCKTRGGVVALDAATGAVRWTAHALPEATPQRDRGDGKMLWGPSGAPIWNSPSIDPARNRVYVGTGEATSAPAHANTNAILAIDLAKGDIKWSRQATPNDIYLIGCGPTGSRLNCERNTVYRDVDFGASTIVAERGDGSTVILAGQKSGMVWALDPDTGKVVWRRDIGTGGPLGGVHWGIAADAAQVYVPIVSIGRPIEGEPPIDPSLKPGLYALDLMTGKINWMFSPEADCEGDRRQRMPQCARGAAFSAAPAAIDGVVVQGGLDGRVFAVDAATGKELFRYDTAQSFETVNGVPGKGGAIDASGVAAGAGMLFVNSGYGMFGQSPGNVLLAFRPKAD
jgi:polyvinyl alcohol dehydrogenase (cytochrome)